MAIYHLNVGVISRSNNQNSVAKAAYNSAERLKDYKEDVHKDYTKKQCDYSEIITPNGVPEEYKNREFLWNKVEHVEKRKDSRLAREFKVALAVELEDKENLEMIKEFADSLAEEGMIVDLNLHKLNSSNPHAHLLCTMRGIDEKGEFEPKRIGNEKVRDWDNKEKLLEWRERWERIENKHLESNGFMERVSHESHEDRNIDLTPTIKEGWKARKMYSETGVMSEAMAHNQKVRKDNYDKINKINENNSKDLNKYDYLNKDQIDRLSGISKELKVFISPNTIMERSIYIDDMYSKSFLINNDDKKNERISELDSKKDLIDDAKKVFISQANNFFNKNYNDVENNEVLNRLSDDDKVYLTHYMIENNYILKPDDFEYIISEKIDKENELVLSNILNNKDKTYESIDSEKEFYMEKLSNILDRNNLSLDHIENIENNSSINKEDYNKVMYYSDRLDRLAIADNILDKYYDDKIDKIFGNNEDSIKSFKEITNTQEKRDIVDFIDFHGEESSLRMIDTGEYINRFNQNERKEILDNVSLLIEKSNKRNPIMNDSYDIEKSKSIMNEKYGINIDNNNDVNHVIKESIYNEDSNIEQFLKGNQESSNRNNYSYQPINFSDVHRNINSLVFSFNEIFKERMTKYQNKEFKSKNHSKQRMDGSNNRNRRSSRRGSGLT